MELNKKLLSELQRRLKVGNRRGVHLNAVPGNSKYKFDLNRLAHIDKNLPDSFIKQLLSEQPLKFKICWNDNSADLNTLFEEDPLQLARIRDSFENLINQADTIESEKGINTFGFGFPILVRRDKSDNKLTVSPLIIWSLRIKRTKDYDTLEITRNEDDSIYLNEVLINHLYSDSNLLIEPLPSEMLEDGLITKNELVEVCSKIIRQINSSVPADVKNTFIHKVDKVVSIGDKNKYEKILINSSAAFIDFGGLFSLFEVQKQNIINEYDNLMDLKGLSLSLEEMENHSFQPISSVETDPSQQSVLHALETKRNILIQGPPGTGKSQTLSAILINALENHRKTIVVCEKRTALEVLQNSLIEKGLEEHCILIRDIVRDRRIVVDSVRERIDLGSNQRSRSNYSKRSLDEQISKAQSLIESINRKHKKLDDKLLGDRNWTDVVGLLLAELNDIQEDVKLGIDKSEFSYSATELNNYLELIKKAENLYTNYQLFEVGSFLNSTKLVGDNPYKIEQEINDSFEEYEKVYENVVLLESRYKSEYFRLRRSDLSEQIENGNKIQKIIIAIYKDFENVSEFRDEEKLKSLNYRSLSIFSKSKRKILQNHKRLKKLFRRLASHYAICNDLMELEISPSNGKNLEAMYELNLRIEQVSDTFQSYIEKEFSAIDLLSFTQEKYETDTLNSIKENCLVLQRKINDEDWTKVKVQFKNYCDFKTRVEKILLDRKEYFNQENDCFTAEFKWFQFYNSLSERKKLLLKELMYQNDWRKSFLIFYLNNLLVNYSGADIPTNNDRHLELKETLAGLENLQLKYIRGYWYSNQIQTSNNFGQRNQDISVKNVYNKRSSKRFRRHSLRKIVQYDPNLFTTFFPVILTTPDVASNLFKGMHRYFDIVMFDEASQLRLEDNLPAILKGKQIIIAGDEHQMPPSNYFSKLFEGTLESEEDIDEEELVFDKDNILLSCESLLDFGVELNFEKQHLDFHYRSRHPYLIDFSNYAFYNQRLKPLPNTFDYTPIKYIQVSGTFSDHINDSEAEMVLSILENNIHRLPNGAYPTVGIATFNIAQRNHIKRKILERQKYSRFEKFNSKIQELEMNGMFIKNLENIQGDERDVIILSTTYGPGKDNRFAQRFGPINHSKGYKLLNVIITRAKYKVYVCSSIPESYYMNYKDYLVTEGANNKRAVFYAYLAYSKAVSENNDDLRVAILNSLTENSTKTNPINFDTFGELESPFEEEVYERLLGHVDESKLIPQMKVSEFRIDIVYDPKIQGVPKIAIECDGAKYHSSKEAYLHDLHRQKILESHGFVFHRIWSTHWWRNPQRETKRLVEFIKEVELSRNDNVAPDDKTSIAFTDEIVKVENYVSQYRNTNKHKERQTIATLESKGLHQKDLFSDDVRLGSIVKVEYLNSSKEVIIQIVEDVTIREKINGVQQINQRSALAVSIIGSMVGDVVKVGNLNREVRIIEIKN